MKPELCFETSGVQGQMRIPKIEAIRNHLSQYETRSMRGQEARRATIWFIVNSLGIPETIVPYHDCNSVNMTCILIDDGRKDLAQKVWMDPETFETSNPDLWGMGLKRIKIELDCQQNSEKGRQIITQWSNELKKIDKVDM